MANYKLDLEEKYKSKEKEGIEETDSFESGWDDDDVREALLVIGNNNSDKSQRDAQNRLINEALREASQVISPTKPRYIGTKRLKQAKSKTIERIQPLKWVLQGDGATEEEEILVTKAVKEALHRGGYDSTFTGKSGVVDKIVTYGDAYRLVLARKSKKTSFPVEFKIVNSENLWFSTKATSFRHGNKNVTQIVALFRGTLRDFECEFPEFKGKVKPGLIPRTYSYKDLDQTNSQQYQSTFSSSPDSKGEDNRELEWAYYFDISKKCYVFFAGADLVILEKEEGEKYSFQFKNLEGKKEPYFPIMNFMGIPDEEGIYNVGVCALLYDQANVFRKSVNWDVGRAEENAYPHTYVNIPEGQEDSFFNLIEMADQMREAGKTAYVPFSASTGGAVASASPLLNGGDANAGANLRNMLDDDFRKSGVYLDEPINASVTATQIEFNASNALTLPKALMKYNAPEIEFEVMVALELLRDNIKKDDPTPLILETTIQLPDVEVSIRNIPFSLGWLKAKLQSKAWRVQVDPETGAVTNDVMLITLYQKMLPNMDPSTPEYAAVMKKLALLTGVSVPSASPISQSPSGESSDPGLPGGVPVPPPTAEQAAGLGA